MILPVRPLLGKLSRKFRWVAFSVLTTCLGVFVASGHVDPSHTHAAVERTMDVRIVPAGNGSLVISGGGDVPRAVRTRFYELAGGTQAHIVVIPTASLYDDAPRLEECLNPWKRFAAASLQMFHTRKRTEANNLTFVKPLTEATGVWIGGGYQERLSEAYVGTEVERQLKALLHRGGVIGGTSAGAAIMTRVMIADGRDKAVMGTGFDFLKGAVVDQHFMKRNRADRLLGVLEEHPNLIGFGIDEDTALVVNVRDNRLRVIGDSYVFACVPDPAGHPNRIEILKPGDEVDIAALKDPGKPIVAAADPEALY